MAKTEKELSHVVIPELGGKTLHQILEAAANTKEQLNSLRNALPFDLVGYTAKDRPGLATQASLKKGEDKALDAIFDAADLAPGTVESITDKDEGSDDALVETDVLRARRFAYQALADLATEAEDFSSDVRDTSFFVGLKVKPIALLAYKLLKNASANSTKIMSALKDAVDHYREVIRPTVKRAKTAKE